MAMQQRETQESNIGLLAYGPVHTQNLVLNIGGQPRPLYEIGTEVLEGKRTTLEAAILHRRRMNMIPRGLTVGMTLFIWSTIPSAFQNVGSDELSKSVIALLALTIGACAAWQLVRLQFGRWQRRNYLTMKQLESALSHIDAELDMRCPASDFTLWAQLQKLAKPIRS